MARDDVGERNDHGFALTRREHEPECATGIFRSTIPLSIHDQRWSICPCQKTTPCWHRNLCAGNAFVVASSSRFWDPSARFGFVTATFADAPTAQPFLPNARILLERYRVIAGEDLISEYESSPGARRCFCSRCGSPVFARVSKDPDHIRIRLGTLDREADAEITAHVWMGSKARWDRLTWTIPSFERGIDSPPA